MRTNLVSCSECARFTPDPVGDGTGIGRCQAYEDYKAQGVSPKALDRAFKALGDKLFWCGTDPEPDRVCGKFLNASKPG